MSSQGWHGGRHDPWPYINYVLFILKTAYREFPERVGEVKAPRGAKRELVLAAIDRLLARPGGTLAAGEFTISELGRVCPGASRDMVRTVLRDEQKQGRGECLGRGTAAAWRKKG